jgi:tetraacyldisaccharide 4'-kinase
VKVRRFLYQKNILTTHYLPVPVIVVGNISVGGTGKTPLVIWMINQLREQGFIPGVISRGYGGVAKSWPQQVRHDSDPKAVGDEAVLIAKRCHCPMAVGPDRVAAAQALLKYSDCNIIVSDDGLQHYPLGRDMEIAVIDGTRRFGNGHLLPAGPLREPKSRLASVDIIVANELASIGERFMKLQAGKAHNLQDPGNRVELQVFRAEPVHAVAAIGNPERFFSALRRAGIEVIPHAFPDHHYFTREELDFGDEKAVLMTEKDAVKCHPSWGSNYWYVPVAAQLDEKFTQQLLKTLERKQQYGQKAS